MSIVAKSESVPVTISTYTLYCESFRAEGNTNWSEKSTVSGGDIISNTAKRAMSLKLSGRICDVLQPVGFIVSINTLMSTGSAVNIEYRGVIFSNCRIVGFTADDSDTDCLEVSVSLITADSPYFREASE